MQERFSALTPWAAGLAGLAGLAVLMALQVSGAIPHEGYRGAAAIMATLGIVALVCLAWYVDVAWLLTAAVIASVFNSNWDAFGFPPGFAPDRLLLLAGLLGLLIYSNGARGRPALRFQAVHLVFALTLAWAVGSAIVAETILEGDTYFTLLDRMAVPIAVFLLAPFAFRTPRHRNVFLAAFVMFGGYLGLTALFETTGPKALVIPHFILDPSFGYHGNRSRGPFLEAGVNGIGLYVCAVASAVAIATWRNTWLRVAAAAVLLLCSLGLLFTLTRSVWVGAVVATIVTFLVTRELRRFLIPAAAAASLIVLIGLAIVPGLDARFDQRKDAQRSIWERRNVNAAAMAMLSERPLLGFGLGTFNESNSEYFPLLDDIPQVAEQGLAIHNAFLSIATELGLIGLTLFLASFGLAIGTALLSRGPPDLRPWRVGLLAIVLCWVVVASFAPLGQVFTNMIPWLWAGIVLGGATGAGSYSRAR